MLFKKIVGVYTENRAKYMKNTARTPGRDFNMKTGGACSKGKNS
jgi:hypothetical protein